MRHEFFSNSYLPEVNRAIGDFVSAELFGKPGRFDKYCSMGVFSDGLLCGVLYHNFMPEFGTVEMSAAALSRRWMSKEILRDMLNMPFDKLGCQAIVSNNSEDAHHLRRMWKKVGAVEYVIPRGRGRDKAEVICMLTQEAWQKSPFHTREMALV